MSKELAQLALEDVRLRKQTKGQLRDIASILQDISVIEEAIRNGRKEDAKFAAQLLANKRKELEQAEKRKKQQQDEKDKFIYEKQDGKIIKKEITRFERIVYEINNHKINDYNEFTDGVNLREGFALDNVKSSDIIPNVFETNKNLISSFEDNKKKNNL